MPPAVPRATVRLQFHAGFRFDDATDLVPYFAALGVSHVYASPFLAARPGSEHGYDIVDHTRFNPELGDEASFDRMVAALHQHGMGLILDFVPNHMGIGGADNVWWLDVLEWGPMSPFASFFDIDWSPADPSLRGKVLLPFLGDHYGNILESGDLALKFDSATGSFDVWYFEHRYPIAVRHYPLILHHADGAAGAALDQVTGAFAALGEGRRSVRAQTMLRRQATAAKQRLAALAASDPKVADALDAAVSRFAGTPGNRDSFRPLHRLLERQSYRLASWRVAAHEINYRRFFDINDLAGLRMERRDLFELAHQLVFRLIAEGKLQGLRLDHIDGLYDPAAYCRQLQDRAAYLLLQAAAQDGTSAEETRPRGNPIYLVVEKILARHERLPESWPVDGTTGYDFMNLVNGLFVDPAAEGAMTDIYDRFVGTPSDHEAAVISAKRQLVRTNLASELNVLASQLHDIARQNWSTRDFAATAIREALLEIVARFPVYRTYITALEVSEEDLRHLEWAVALARKDAGFADTGVHEFILSVLGTGAAREPGRRFRRRDVIAAAMKFQQLTGPVMAKAVEDTAFYRYFRLVSLNEVGGEPHRFGTSPAAFHHLNQERARRHPDTMLATASHDHKRGEDTRTRIDVLSEMPGTWERAVQLWSRANRTRVREVDGAPAPDANDEYLYYQTLVGTWPSEGIADTGYADRMVQYMLKAVREAKRRSSWSFPSEDYEAAVEEFVRSTLDPEAGAWFLADLAAFAARTAVVGASNGLAQTLLKITVPGVPDVYQGAEYWDLSLVDPDNRRPIDFDARRHSLTDLADLDTLLAQWRDGRIKQRVLAQALDLRRRLPSLFADGAYIPLATDGAEAHRVVAFAREWQDNWLIAVTPRLVAPLLEDRLLPLVPAELWGDTVLTAPDLPSGLVLEDVFSGRSRSWEAGATVPVNEVLGEFPVALLAAEVAR